MNSQIHLAISVGAGGDAKSTHTLLGNASTDMKDQTFEPVVRVGASKHDTATTINYNEKVSTHTVYRKPRRARGGAHTSVRRALPQVDAHGEGQEEQHSQQSVVHVGPHMSYLPFRSFGRFLWQEEDTHTGHAN